MNHLLFNLINERLENTKYIVLCAERITYIGTIENTKTFIIISNDSFNINTINKEISQHFDNPAFEDLIRLLSPIIIRSKRIKKILESL